MYRNQKNKKEKEETGGYGEEGGFDETFAFIAGFTEGGAPFGVTWEDAKRLAAEEGELINCPFEEDDEKELSF